METATFAGFRKEQEITREELTATVLQRYLQNNHPEFEQLEIRHSEEGEQLHGEVGNCPMPFCFRRLDPV